MMGALGRLLSPGGQGESSTKTLMDGKQLEGARPITFEDTQLSIVIGTSLIQVRSLPYARTYT